MCHYWGVSADGRLVVFDSYSTNLVPGNMNGIRDIFRCDRTSTLESYCYGDGALATPCPCGNTGTAGRGCENSSATGGARLQAPA